MATAGDDDGEYRLMKRLGAGAFGEVWKVKEKSTRKLLAMKIIPFAKNVYKELESCLNLPYNHNIIR